MRIYGHKRPGPSGNLSGNGNTGTRMLLPSESGYALALHVGAVTLTQGFRHYCNYNELYYHDSVGIDDRLLEQRHPL